MNHIKNIEIKNFKSIRHQKIEDCRRINVFIGYPNVGKSNILEAISLASGFDNNSHQISLKDICRFDELIGLYNDGDKQKKIELTINGFSYFLEYFDQNNLQYGVIEQSLETNDTAFDLTKFSKRSIINQAGTLSSISTHTERKQPEIKIKKYQFRGVQSNVRNNPINLDYPFGSNLFEVIRYDAELRKKCGELFNFFNLKLAFDEDIKLKIQKQLDEYSVFQIPMIQVSDTLQRLIFHSAAIATNQNTVLLFEEPEAHMFPPYVKKFTSDVIFDETNQFFIATHSPYVLSEFIEEAAEDLAAYVIDYDKGETIIKRLTENEVLEVAQYGIDLFFNLESYLDKNVQPHSA